MFCHKCKVDVHPAKIMATKAGGEGDGKLFSGGFYNQCPRCQCPLPDDEPPAVVSPKPLAPVVALPTAKPAPRSGSLIDTARAELAQVDEEIARLESVITNAKTEIAIKKAHRKGLLRVVLTYERAMGAIAPSAEQPPRH